MTALPTVTDPHAFFERLSPSTMKFGLDRMRACDRALGHPHRSYRVLHVAGTNGKGSTSAMIAAGLREAGHRVGLFTSPHVIEPTERIVVDGRAVSTEEFAEAFAAVPAALRAALVRRGFTGLTAVQSAVLAANEQDRDLQITSQTGSGKTVAFGLAASQALVKALDGKPRLRTERGQNPLVLVVAPTRELALQVQRELSWLYAPLGARVTSSSTRTLGAVLP